MRFLRSAFFFLLLPLITLETSLATLIAGHIFHWAPSRLQLFPTNWGRMLCWIAGVTVHVHGSEHLLEKQPMILAANHQSLFDIAAIQGYVNKDIRWMAKKELFRIPFFGPAMRVAGFISVHRGHGREALKGLALAAEQIRAGASVVIFPEGTRSPDGSLQPFKSGGIFLALKAGVPILPVGISGSGKVLPKGHFFPRPGTIIIRIGPPLDPSGFSAQDKKKLAAALQKKISALLPDEQKAA